MSDQRDIRFPEPTAVINKIEHWAVRHLADVQQYENVTPLNESAMYNLHTVAAEIYAMGFADGETAEHSRAMGQFRRDKDFGGSS